MVDLVLVTEAAEHSQYSEPHIRLLVRTQKVKGKKQGGIWLVNLDDLKRYEQEMLAIGSKKFDPTKYNE